MTGRILTAWMVLAGWHCCLAQSSDPAATKTALASAIEGQRRVLADLARILREERVMLSDGAVQAALEALLKDETKQEEGIREWGRRTLGKSSEELTDQDRSDRDQMAENQDVYADRYRRLEKGIETKAGAKPDSVFASLLAIADEAQLRQRLAEASELIRGNQPGRALSITREIIAALQKMVGAVSQNSGTTTEDKGAGAPGFMVPGKWIKAPGQSLVQFGWAGGKVDSLIIILRSLKQLEELTERQRKVAEQTKARAGKQAQTADDLAREEWEIRYYALDVAAKLALLDPQLEQMIRTAAGTIEQAIPGMEKGPLTDAVEPAGLAADQLQAAADRLRTLWKGILERIKQFTMQANDVMGGSMGIPHGMSKEMAERLQSMIFNLLRATGALTDAINRETALLDQTRQSDADDQLPGFKPGQDALIQFVTDEVIPFNVSAGDLPQYAQSTMSRKMLPTAELLEDTVDRMKRSAAALDGKDKPEAVKRQTESVELMNDALQLMMEILARLLGQFAPPGMSKPDSGGASGMTLDPASGNGKPGGWMFGLPSEQRESVRQAFRGEFPQRYDHAIKLYYQAIAAEEASAASP